MWKAAAMRKRIGMTTSLKGGWRRKEKTGQRQKTLNLYLVPTYPIETDRANDIVNASRS